MTRKTRAFAAGVKLGVLVAEGSQGSLADLVLAIEAAYPGAPGASMDLPPELWAELVTLALLERAHPGAPAPVLHPAPIALKTTSAEPVGEGEPLVVEGLRTVAPAPEKKRRRVLVVQDLPPAEAPVEAAP